MTFIEVKLFLSNSSFNNLIKLLLLGFKPEPFLDILKINSAVLTPFLLGILVYKDVTSKVAKMAFCIPQIPDHRHEKLSVFDKGFGILCSSIKNGPHI